MRFAWALSVVVLLVFYAPVFRDLTHHWGTNTYAGHGVFVPLFSALFLWMDRDRLRTVSNQGDLRGWLLVFMGLGINSIGEGAQSILLECVSIVVAVAGVTVLGFGWGCLRAAAFPIGFLVLMVPLPDTVVQRITGDIQLFVAKFTAFILSLLGIPVYQRGVIIELPEITLEIAELCNGLRFLMALLVLTISFAHVSQRSIARKLALVASAIPLGIAANVLRVVAIALAAHHLGPHMAFGTPHHLIGKAVWVLTLVPLFALGLMLRRAEVQEDAQVTTGKYPQSRELNQ